MWSTWQGFPLELNKSELNQPCTKWPQQQLEIITRSVHRASRYNVVSLDYLTLSLKEISFSSGIMESYSIGYNYSMQTGL